MLCSRGRLCPAPFPFKCDHRLGQDGSCRCPLDNTASVAHSLREGTFAEFFPGLVVIGSNGAGEAIAFDFRQGVANGIVCFDMTNIDLTESIRHLAASFTELMSLVPPRGGMTVR